MTEYRVRIEFAPDNIRDKIIECKTLQRAEKVIDDLENDWLGMGKVKLSLAPYWHGYTATIETREVTEWTRL
jgi:hypothetical protein